LPGVRAVVVKDVVDAFGHNIGFEVGQPASLENISRIDQVGAIKVTIRLNDKRAKDCIFFKERFDIGGRAVADYSLEGSLWGIAGRKIFGGKSGMPSARVTGDHRGIQRTSRNVG
jgi:hypothetical protein